MVGAAPQQKESCHLQATTVKDQTLMFSKTPDFPTESQINQESVDGKAGGKGGCMETNLTDDLIINSWLGISWRALMPQACNFFGEMF